jgi:hypothetical protein
MNAVIPAAMAEEVFLPPAQGAVALSAAFTPCQLRGVRIDPQDPFKLDFIVDEGNSGLKGQAFEEESQRLIKYFLATLTTPEKDLWVNLSPYEDNRIIQDDFGRTAMGRDLLAQDYLLKQITASLMHPDSDLGKKFWAEIYKRVFEKYGTTDIPVDTFNKVWIVPERAVIYESSDVGRGTSDAAMAAYIDEARLKVMLESDYLAAERSDVGGRTSDGSSDVRHPTSDNLNSQATRPTLTLAKDVVREVVIPVLEREVNEGKNFAPLRQVYYSLLLAVWLKKKLQTAVPVTGVEEKPGFVKGNILSMIFVNQHKTGGLETADPRAEVRTIYDRYVEAFRKGAYDLIREDYDLYSQELIPRKYFSGGLDFSQKNLDGAMETRIGSPAADARNFRAVATKLDFAQKSGKRKPVITVVIPQSAVRTAVILTVSSAIALTSFLGYFTYRALTPPPTVTAPARVPTVDLNRPLDAPAIRSILGDVTNALRNYQTGDLHRKKGARDNLFTPEITIDEFLERMTAPGDEEDMTAEKLAEILNEMIDSYGAPLMRMGLTRTDISSTILHLIAKESEGFMGKSQLVGKRRDIIQARGGSQVEWETFKVLMSVAVEVLSQDSFKSVEKYSVFLERVKKEMKRKLGSEKYNRWISKNPKDMVVLSRDHLALLLIWLSHLVESQPSPPEVEFSRLDGLYLGENGAASRWVNPEPPLLEVLQQLKKDKQFASLDQKAVQIVSLAAAWNGGNNVSADQRAYWIRFLLSDDQEQMRMVKMAGRQTYAAFVEREKAKNNVKTVLGKKNINDLFSDDSGTREKMLRRTKGYLKGRPMEEKVKFAQAWEQYRATERKFKDVIWKVRNAPQVADVYYILGALNGKSYEVGRKLRSNLDEFDKVFKAVTKSMEGYRKGRDKVPDLSGIEISKDNAMTPYGGIDLQTDRMDLNIVGNAGAFQIEIPTVQLEQLKKDVTGFVPLILNVEPLQSLPAFLGMAENDAGGVSG